MEWISVKDRLPEKRTPVIVSDEGCVMICELDTPNGWMICAGDGYLWSSYCDMGTIERTWDVTHWMPLPEPPKE